MISDPATEFGLGSAPDRLCVFGQVAAFLPQHHHLHKERSEGWSLASLSSKARSLWSGTQPHLTISKCSLLCYFFTYIKVILVPYPAPSLAFVCPDVWRDSSSLQCLSPLSYKYLSSTIPPPSLKGWRSLRF